MPKVAYHADISAMSGKQGDQVYSQTRNGAVRKSRVIPTNPNTPLQASSRGNFSVATVGYSQMAASLLLQWEAYAASLKVTDPVTMKTYSPAPGTVYTGLTSKYLQVNVGSAPPLLPPKSAFTGDTITVSAAGEPGHVTFTASAANATNVVTELMVQKLPSTARKPAKDKDRTVGFIAFAGTVLTHDVTLPTGIYACAYRFVNKDTGQMTSTVRLPTVTVT